MISLVQVKKIESMLKDGWMIVGRKRSDTNRTLGGPTLLSRNGEYVWVGADGQSRPATADDVSKW